MHHPCTTHARPSFPVDPDPNPTPPNQGTPGLHDTATELFFNQLQYHFRKKKTADYVKYLAMREKEKTICRKNL